jgi:hypothetical protein
MKAIFLARAEDGTYHVGLVSDKSSFESKKYYQRQGLQGDMEKAPSFSLYARAYAEVQRLQEANPTEVIQVAEVELGRFEFKVLSWLE